ncbi:helix-turn-helix domain-containing protein [Halorussus salinisoli]|uniref:helix-turn-helix domain-containing protein n=1 Tax=Halorussus salinisoli TaxID=2558242 RepID=UPI0010C179AE|nr:helix-turn-helix domain-containing protein [Halorussus salinisoli]
MAKLSNVAVDDLHAAVERVSTGKAAKRLMIALAYKDGVTVDTLSERYDIPRSTVYYWLDRFEELSIDEAIKDDDRPGRPSALTPDEREQLQAELVQSPAAFGFDAAAWTTELIRDHIEEQYGVTYSYGHIRRLRRAFETESA